MSVSYDSVSIQDNDNYIPKIVDHISAPDREINYYDLSLRGGSKVVDAYYKSKEIVVSGIVKGDTASEFQQKVDELKELFSRIGKNLDISWRSTTRRYKCTCISHTLPSDYYNLTFINYEARFLAYEGFGRSISDTSISTSNVSTAVFERSTTITGSCEAMPTITVSVDSETSLTAIKFKTNSTTDEISIPYAYTAGDVLIINCENKTITINGTAVDYTGNFPRFAPGSLTYTFTMTSTANQVDMTISYTPLWL